MRIWKCMQCGTTACMHARGVADEAAGWPDEGIAPGPRWEDVPDDWTCPDCGTAKADFRMMAVA